MEPFPGGLEVFNLWEVLFVLLWGALIGFSHGYGMGRQAERDSRAPTGPGDLNG